MTHPEVRDIFVTGGTGYIGRSLIPALLGHGHRVRALVRQESVGRVPAGAVAVVGDALRAESIAKSLKPGDTLVHLVGTPHPGPSKAAEFLSVDLASIRASVEASRTIGVSHLVYVSVAQPAPVMKAYQAARAQGEAAIAGAGLTASVLRPFYVLGPGHRWPLALVPMYAVATLLPRTRAAAIRLGLVSLSQMVRSLVQAIEDPPATGAVRMIDVPGIRSTIVS